MLKKFTNSMNDKGDGKMNSKNSILRLGITALMLCLLAATFITGCGGANSSGGSTANPTQPSTNGTLPTSYAITGKIVADGTTQAPIGSITVKLFIQNTSTNALVDTSKQYTSLTSGEFSFSGLAKGTYVIKAEGNASYYESSKLLIISDANTVANIETGNLVMAAKTSFVPGTYTLIAKVVSDGQSETPIPDIAVQLFVQNTTELANTGRSSTSLSSGEIIFTGLSTGTYVLQVAASAKYQASSKLAIINTSNSVSSIDAGNLVLISQPTSDPGVATLDLTGRLVDNDTPLSVAVVSLDSGQSTVSDGLGIFTLRNIASGTRRLFISKPGVASKTISFEVVGTVPPNATAIKFGGNTYNVNSGTRMVDLTTSTANDIEVTPNLHSSGILRGTVKRFVMDTSGYMTKQEGLSYEFDLWQVYPDLTARRFGSVVSKSDGSWMVDNLPPFEDNSALWFAVPINTSVSVQQGNAGNVAVFENSSAIWANRDPVLAYGYKVTSGEATVMDFTLPTFLFSNSTGSVNPISDAGFAATSAGAATANYEASIGEDMYAKWTGPGTSTVVTFEFNRAYKQTAPTPIQLSFPITNTGATAAHVQVMKPLAMGLDYGRYTWRTLVNDPAVSGLTISSSNALLTVRPSNTEMSPQNGTVYGVPVATHTVTFVAPADSDATQAVLEFYQVVGGTRVLVGRSNEPTLSTQAVFNLTWPGNSPAAGNYEWRVGYFYPDGPPMYSQYSSMTFQ